jgi:hypothetical protein
MAGCAVSCKRPRGGLRRDMRLLIGGWWTTLECETAGPLVEDVCGCLNVGVYS